MSYKERVTLVTGATRGIGRACSEHLASQGHTIVGMARSAPTGDFPGESLIVDLADRGAAAEALSEVTQKFPINGIINSSYFYKISTCFSYNSWYKLTYSEFFFIRKPTTICCF